MRVGAMRRSKVSLRSRFPTWLVYSLHSLLLALYSTHFFYSSSTPQIYGWSHKTARTNPGTKQKGKKYDQFAKRLPSQAFSCDGTSWYLLICPFFHIPPARIEVSMIKNNLEETLDLELSEFLLKQWVGFILSNWPCITGHKYAL